MPQRGQLAEQVYETVKYRLRYGVYKGGERISVAGLANELGISRQPVMDGLRRLATQRFLEIIPQVGVRVVATERREMQDFFRMLAAMESVCATLAAERADEQGAAQLTEINEQIGALLSDDIDDADRARSYRALNRDFHHQLCALTGSDVLTRISAFMWDHSDFLSSSGFEAKVLMSRLRAAYNEHKLICSAVAENDPDAARQAMEGHLLAFSNNVASA